MDADKNNTETQKPITDSSSTTANENSLENLIDKDKLPLQTNSNDSNVATNNKLRFFKKPIFRKAIIPLAVLLIIMVVISIVVSLFKRGSQTIQNKGELVWWGIKEEDSVVAGLITDFQSQNPEVRVTYVRQSEKDYAERLHNSLKSGKGPDIFEIHTSWIPNFRGMYSYLPDDVISESEYKNTFLPAIYNSLKTSGGIVGIPLYYDALTLYVNVDIFTNARKDFPKTWNDILFLSDPDTGGLTLYQEKDLVQSAVALGNTKNVDNWQDILALMLIQNKINPANPDIPSLNKVISYYKDFQRSGVWSERLPASTVSFARGNLAMYFGTVSRVPEILRLNSSIRFKTIPLPQLPNEKPTDPKYAYANYTFQAVGKSSTNQKLAWKFLKFMSEKDSIAKLNTQRKAVRAIDFPSPRNDMKSVFEKDAIIGSVLEYSDVAKVWYLADEAYDSAGGINVNMEKLYKQVVDEGTAEKGFTTDLKNMLGKFGVSTK